ncbi:MAG: hypothetical protein LPK58_06595 [Gammaproteobacteria bacterium]|nr:hypothetical protein [Gammaproteobacteria bacterium]MDX5375242.1 hypothetical protein [Gammaproteobacteria bacterium]
MLQTLLSWLGQHETLLLWAGALSALGFIASLALLPWLVVRIPPDYFHQRHPFLDELRDRHPVLRWALFLLKNLFGALVLLMGIAMLVLPGQGLITIMIGLLLLNFPGKFALERWVVTRPGVLRAINWMRGRYGHLPITLPPTRELDSP